MKTFDEVKDTLNACVRHELRDHAFGDREVDWEDETGEIIASGYFGGSGGKDVAGLNAKGEKTFSGREAGELLKCGKQVRIERNDSTGPDEYQEGACMPGLTLEGVREELCTPPKGK